MCPQIVPNYCNVEIAADLRRLRPDRGLIAKARSLQSRGLTLSLLKQTNKQTNKHTNKQTNKQTYKQPKSSGQRKLQKLDPRSSQANKQKRLESSGSKTNCKSHTPKKFSARLRLESSGADRHWHWQALTGSNIHGVEGDGDQEGDGNVGDEVEGSVQQGFVNRKHVYLSNTKTGSDQEKWDKSALWETPRIQQALGMTEFPLMTSQRKCISAKNTHAGHAGHINTTLPEMALVHNYAKNFLLYFWNSGIFILSWRSKFRKHVTHPKFDLPCLLWKQLYGRNTQKCIKMSTYIWEWTSKPYPIKYL